MSATLVGGWEDSVDAELVAGPSSPVDLPSSAFVVVASLLVVTWVQAPHWAGQFLRTNSPITESLHLPRYPPAEAARAHGAGSPAPLQASVVVVVVVVVVVMVVLELVDVELVMVVLELEDVEVVVVTLMQRGPSRWNPAEQAVQSPFASQLVQPAEIPFEKLQQCPSRHMSAVHSSSRAHVAPAPLSGKHARVSFVMIVVGRGTLVPH